MKLSITRSGILALSVALLSSTGLTSCAIVKAIRKSTSEMSQKNKKTKISEEDKAKAKAKLANAKTVGTKKNSTSSGSAESSSIEPRLSAQSNVNRNLETLPMPANPTGLIDPEVDDIPSAKELEEVETPAPKTLPSVTLPGQ